MWLDTIQDVTSSETPLLWPASQLQEIQQFLQVEKWGHRGVSDDPKQKKQKLKQAKEA
jgi:hypothetical protein